MARDSGYSEKHFKPRTQRVCLHRLHFQAWPQLNRAWLPQSSKDEGEEEEDIHILETTGDQSTL